MEPKWAILGQNANSFILVFLFSIRIEGAGTMRDLAGWYLGWYRAARAWRLHRGLIPAPKGLCGHKEAINLACNPSGGWNLPHPTFRGPDKSSVHPCLLHAHWPGSTQGLSINGTAYPSMRIEQGPNKDMSSSSIPFYKNLQKCIQFILQRLVCMTITWTPKT